MPYNSYTPSYAYSMYAPNSYAMQPQQSAAPQPQQQTGIIWVDGEVGAKAQQLPAGWPANTPLPLWDTNDTIIYLKSTNQMGMPNPLQKLFYTMEEQPAPRQECRSAAPALMSGEDKYVTREDLERMKTELCNTITDAMSSQSNAKKGGRSNESAV